MYNFTFIPFEIIVLFYWVLASSTVPFVDILKYYRLTMRKTIRKNVSKYDVGGAIFEYDEQDDK